MTKRKSEEEKAAGMAKERVAFTAPKDAATKAMYEAASTRRLQPSVVLTFKNNSVARNASCSPLLRMPLEIRNKMWALVLGDRLIHLQYLDMNSASKGQDEKKQCWSNIVCKRDCPENEMAEEDIVWQQSHHRCAIELSRNLMGANHQQSGQESMHLTALRVCRQTYNEANNVLWSTNTFSFDDADVTFDRFMDARTTRQKRSLRKLRLQMHWDCGEEILWNRVLGMPLIRSLAGLRSLRLHINHSIKAAFYQKVKARGNNELGLFQTRHVESVHRMAILPLTHVEVFVSDFSQARKLEALRMAEDLTAEDWTAEYWTAEYWTAEDRTEYGEGIRRILLDPQGAEIYAREQEELKEFYRQDRERKK